MKITKVSCDWFAGVRGCDVSFTDGVNVICGKNESGKSTLVNLLFSTLFQGVKLDGRNVDDKRFAKAYFPAPKKHRGAVGDSIDGEVTLEGADGTYVLTKEWGADPSCTLITPTGKWKDMEKIDNDLKQLLVYGKGVYADMLFTSQSAGAAALKRILDASEKTEAKKEVLNAVSQAFAESDGIPMDAVEQAITARINDLGKHWDEQRQLPARTSSGGVYQNGGAVFTAYNAWMNSRRVLEEISRLEEEADRAAVAYNEKDAAARAAEESYNRFHAFHGQLSAQSSHKKNVAHIEQELSKITDALAKWPQLTATVERAKELRDERHHRALLDMAQAVNAERGAVSEADRQTAAAACPEDAELVRVRAAQRELQKLENQLCGMNLTADLQMLGGHTVEITSLRTGEMVEVSGGTAAITEAVLITVPGVMEMRLAPANVDVSALEGQMDVCRGIVADTLSKYGADTVEALEVRAKAIAAAKAKIEQMNSRVLRILGNMTPEQLEEQIVAIPDDVRAKEAIDADVYGVCGGADPAAFILRNEALLDNYAAEYGSVDKLKIKAFDLQTELTKAKASVSAVEDIPAEYAYISDPDAHLARLQEELKIKQGAREMALTAKTYAAGKLETYRDGVTGDPAEERDKARRRLDEQKALLAHWRHIYEVFRTQKEGVKNDPTKDIADRFAYYLGRISGGRVSSAFPEADKLQMDIYSGDILLDYDKLSDGTRETVALAFRLAVLDHLFPEGGGVIVFDDPFTDMDEERMAQSCALVQECAQRHQVIFLTCREEYAAMLQGNLIRV